MATSLKEVHINNFKSLRDVKIPLDKFNVIVGRNGSGKTNIIEIFKFLRNALVEKKRPYMPYIDWWSYHNIVWMGKTELPIRAALRLDIDGHDITYEIEFRFVGGVFSIPNERMTFDHIVFMEREGQILRVRHDEEFLRANAAKIRKLLRERRKEFKEKTTTKDLLEHTIKLPIGFSNLINLMEHSFGGSFSQVQDLTLSVYRLALRGEEYCSIVLPSNHKRGGTRDAEEEDSEELPLALKLFLGEFRSIFERFTILRHPSISDIKRPSIPRKEEVLLEDSSNLHNVLYYWFLEKGGKIPERIEKALLELLPNIQILPSLTSDGKVFIKMFEKGVELDPPCIPDGVYKLLAILAGIELKPTLLAIDEIENSLYAEALEYVIDELRNSGTTVIVTTHSPLVVDMAKLEELFISEWTSEGTVLEKVKNPEKLREKLRKLKLTQSESWLYGGFK